MKIILLKDDKKIGKKGNIKNVADGYALNYLLPNKIAALATPEKIAWATKQKDKQTQVKQAGEKNISNLIGRLTGKKITITGKISDGGKLFAGVGAKEITAKLKDQFGVEIEERFIALKKHLKDIGEHKVAIDFGAKRKVDLKVIIKNEN